MTRVWCTNAAVVYTRGMAHEVRESGSRFYAIAAV
jgi:hypothetical protein